MVVAAREARIGQLLKEAFPERCSGWLSAKMGNIGSKFEEEYERIYGILPEQGFYAYWVTGNLEIENEIVVTYPCY